MRSLPIIIALLTWIPLWGQAPGVGIDPSHNQKQQTKLGGTQPQADQRGTQNSPVIVDMVQHPKSEQETAEAKAEKNHKTYIDRWTLGIAGIVALFTGLLVIVGWRGVNAAKRTLRAIERQATLQAASMTQAVTPDNWRVEVLHWQESRPDHPKMLSVTFDIVDESNFPLTINSKFRFCGNLPGAPTHIINGGVASPRKPYTSMVHLYPTQEQSIEYAKGMLRISVHGEYTHMGVLGKQGAVMGITGNLVCGSLVPVPFMEFESIRLIPTEPPPRLGLRHYLGLYWESCKRKDGGQGLGHHRSGRRSTRK